MGLFFGGRSDRNGLERDRPCELAPRYRYRVVLGSESGKRESPQIVWLTNELEYARLLAARLNALASSDRAWVEAWNRAAVAAQSRWIRLRAK